MIFHFLKLSPIYYIPFSKRKIAAEVLQREFKSFHFKLGKTKAVKNQNVHSACFWQMIRLFFLLPLICIRHFLRRKSSKKESILSGEWYGIQGTFSRNSKLTLVRLLQPPLNDQFPITNEMSASYDLLANLQPLRLLGCKHHQKYTMSHSNKGIFWNTLAKQAPLTHYFEASIYKDYEALNCWWYVDFY